MTSSQLETTLRPATDADIPFLLELRRQNITPHQIASGAEATERERHERVLYRFDCAQVVVRDGAPVGILKLTRDGLDWHLVQIQIALALQSRSALRWQRTHDKDGALAFAHHSFSNGPEHRAFNSPSPV